MIEIDETVEAAAVPEVVYAVVTRLDRYPDWLPGVLSAEVTDGSADPVAAAGRRFRLRIAGPAGPLDADGEVVAADPPRSVEIRAGSGLFNLQATCAVEASASGSTIRVTGRIEPRGLARFAEGMIRSEIASGMPAALARLRSAIEAEAART